VEIAEQTTNAVDDAVRHSLSTELDARGLLLTGDALAAAGVDASRAGAALFRRLIAHCYPGSQHTERTTSVEFDGHQAASNVEFALAFGAVTANVIAPPNPTGDEPPTDSVDLLCAVFNLGIGMIDGLCDGTPRIGLPFLQLVQEMDVAVAADQNWPRDQLQSALPALLATDATAAFTARVVAVFFDLLHVAYPGDQWSALRRNIGAQLESALEAERRSVDRSVALTTREQIDCSRLTSVVPFQIIEALASPNHGPPQPTPGTLLGEAMWRIDDLVDLAADIRVSALNGVLLATTDTTRTTDAAAVPTLEEVLTSGAIPAAATLAVEYLDAGLTATAADARDRHMFLSFVQRYAGIAAAGDLRPGR
jgi:hypothetical protein